MRKQLLPSQGDAARDRSLHIVIVQPSIINQQASIINQHGCSFFLERWSESMHTAVRRRSASSAEVQRSLILDVVFMIRCADTPQLSQMSPARLCDQCFDLVTANKDPVHGPGDCPQELRPSRPGSTDASQVRRAAMDLTTAAVTAIGDTTTPNYNPDPAVTVGIKALMSMLLFSGRTTLTAVKVANPLKEFQDRPVECWKEHGWAIFPPTAKSRILAVDFAALVEKEKYYKTSKRGLDTGLESVIAGGVIQTSINKFAPVVLVFRQLAIEALESVAPTFFDDIKAGTEDKQRWAAQADKLWAGEAKALVSSKGKGMQPLHWDSSCWQDVDKSKSSVTALFYGLDCDTTLVPAYSADRFTPEVDQHNQLLMMARAPLLDKRLFCGASVKAGTLLLFRHSVPHAGVVCRGDRRIVLFSALSRTPKELERLGETQYFEWNYIRDAFGARSPEYKESLQKNKDLSHEPVEREPPSERRALRIWLEEKKESSEIAPDEQPEEE